MYLSSDFLQLDIEDEVSAGRDVTRETLLAVAEVAGDDQSGLLADLHRGDTLIPALDDLANADPGLKVAAADGGVELLSLLVWRIDVAEVASVLNSDGLALLGNGTSALLEENLLNAHDGGVFLGGSWRSGG